MKIRNTSAIPLRAAYLHGPYTLYAACYPLCFDPNSRQRHPEEHGNPEFEPNIRAGGSWGSRLTIPSKIRDTAHQELGNVPSITWIVEISSQVIFSTTATVHYELLIGRDERSVDLGFPGLVQAAAPVPGQLHDHQKGRRHKNPRGHGHVRGVFSKAVQLDVDDTASLWAKPAFPNLEPPHPHEHDNRPEQGIRGEGLSRQGTKSSVQGDEPSKPHKRRKLHLVVLTHGLHSNTGSDMLYMKESIDTAVREGRYRSRRKAQNLSPKVNGSYHPKDSVLEKDQASEQQAPISHTQSGADEVSDDNLDQEDDEQVIVRGFNGNAVRTEKGVQYLGKRLAKWILSMTYPDQPFLPTKRSMSRTLSRALTGSLGPEEQLGKPVHQHSTIHLGKKSTIQHDYKVTSISFIGHSLGGLTQTYAIAYIQKHSPHFFEHIKPINFVALASPFLGLSNENPMYVKFALDFGLVGRTGQDLGLSWRAPTMVRSGWDAMIGGIGSEGQRAHKQPDPGSKPLLRVLPTGPAHHALKLFRNRTIYSNVVNDGIVPLRTSCLLFLDWSGLGRVEKARRDNGFVGTMASWGWAEATGQNASSRHILNSPEIDSGSETPGSRSTSRTRSGRRKTKSAVPQPAADATGQDDGPAAEELPEPSQFLGNAGERFQDGEKHDTSQIIDQDPKSETQNPFASFLNLLKPNPAKAKPQQSPKNTKIYTRSQTRSAQRSDTVSHSSASPPPGSSPPNDNQRQNLVRGDSVSSLIAPPKTTFFEAAGDILNPPLPSLDFIINPASRPRTIFHDRVYHPKDIPPPPPITKKPSALSRSFSGDRRPDFARTNTDYVENSSNTLFASGNSNNSAMTIDSTISTNGMKPEEKIARAYHHDLSWRKVLVRLERESHNNIFVRRMFANAYGWPVVKHVCDTHFSESPEAETRDEDEGNEERARPLSRGIGEDGKETKQSDVGEREEANSVHDEGSKKHEDGARNPEKEIPKPQRTDSENRESGDLLSDLRPPIAKARSFNDLKPRPRQISRSSSSHSNSSRTRSGSGSGGGSKRRDSLQWDDKLFDEGTSDEDDNDDDNDNEEEEEEKEDKNNEINGQHNKNKHHEEIHVPKIDPKAPTVLSPAAIENGEKKSLGAGSESPVALRSNIGIGNSATGGGGQLQAGTGSLGLRKSVEERIASAKEDGG